MAVTIAEERIPRGKVQTTINYYVGPENGEQPFNYVEAPPTGQPERNFGDVQHDIVVEDARGRESEFNLDKDSFLLLQNVGESRETSFSNDASIRSTYYPEVEKVLFDHVPNCKKVFIFDHTIRSLKPGTSRPPLTRCHLDQTPYSARQRVKHHLPEEADELLRHRYRIINVWMPINGPVMEYPLGIVSASTASEADFVGIKHIYPHRTGETGGVRYSDQHKWYYWSGVDGSERILLQCFDSDSLKSGSKVVGGRAPHSAFEDPRTPQGIPHRISIEVRALAFC